MLVDQPIRVGQQMYVEQPRRASQAVFLDQPMVSQQPLRLTQQPQPLYVDQQPLRTTQPVLVEQPVLVNQPMQVNQPLFVDQQPLRTNQPVLVEQPLLVSQQPMRVTQPVFVDQPVRVNQPLYADPPPMRVAQPVYVDQQPIRVNQPIYVEQQPMRMNQSLSMSQPTLTNQTIIMDQPTLTPSQRRRSLSQQSKTYKSGKSYDFEAKQLPAFNIDSRAENNYDFLQEEMVKRNLSQVSLQKRNWSRINFKLRNDYVNLVNAETRKSWSFHVSHISRYHIFPRAPNTMLLLVKTAANPMNQTTSMPSLNNASLNDGLSQDYGLTALIIRFRSAFLMNKAYVRLQQSYENVVGTDFRHINIAETTGYSTMTMGRMSNEVRTLSPVILQEQPSAVLMKPRQSMTTTTLVNNNAISLTNGNNNSYYQYDRVEPVIVQNSAPVVERVVNRPIVLPAREEIMPVQQSTYLNTSNVVIKNNTSSQEVNGYQQRRSSNYVPAPEVVSYPEEDQQSYTQNIEVQRAWSYLDAKADNDSIRSINDYGIRKQNNINYFTYAPDASFDYVQNNPPPREEYRVSSQQNNYNRSKNYGAPKPKPAPVAREDYGQRYYGGGNKNFLKSETKRLYFNPVTRETELDDNGPIIWSVEHEPVEHYY